MTKTAKLLSYIVGLILAVVPFHAFLTVWLASGIGHYTLLRLWEEVFLAVLAAGAGVIIWRDKSLRKQLFAQQLSWLICAYIGLTLIWAAVAYHLDKVTAKAVGYGLIVNLRFMVLFLGVWVIAAKSRWLSRAWPKLIFWPAAIVASFGILQALVLPYDFLKHFGYGDSTIFPYETINHNLHYIRAMSTLRGANPLGAYLLIIISALSVWLIKKSRQWWMFLLALLCSLALILSYSREAWLGLVASLTFLSAISIKRHQARKTAELVTAAIIIVVAVATLWLRHNSTFQNYVFHTQTGSNQKVSSNAQHRSALREGVRDLVHQPLGEGVGTAGPASVYNKDRARIAENYFVQIGQETGWVGLALFLAIYINIGWQLWLKRQDNLALSLLVGLVGLTVVSLFSHAWTDDTLAYLWWGLVGISLGADILKSKKYGRIQE